MAEQASSDGLLFRRGIVFFAALLISLLLLNGPGASYFYSAILYADDLNHLPRYFSTGNFNVSGKPLFESTIEWLGSANSLDLIRFGLSLIISISSACLALAIHELTRRPVFSLLAGLILLVYPFSVDQGIFIIGSHPAVAVVFASISLLAGTLAIERNAHVVRAALIIASVLAAYTSGLASPNALLMPLAPAGLAAIFFFRRRPVSALALIFLSVISMALFAWQEGIGYHYEGAGLVDYSLENILTRLTDAIVHIAIGGMDKAGIRTFALFALFWAVLLVVLGYALYALFAARGSGRTFGKFVHALCASLGALFYGALFFGPAAVTVALAARYTYGPGLFAGAALAIFIGVLLRGAGRPSTHFTAVALSACGIVLLSDALLLRQLALNLEFDDDRRVARRLSDWIEAETDTWPENAQVILIVDTEMESPSSSFIHWSSGLVQLNSGRQDLAALIGYERDIEHPLFLKDEFRIENGMRQRNKMTNFTEDRPIFAYRARLGGEIAAVPAILHLGGGASAVTPRGETRQQAGTLTASAIEDMCAGGPETAPLVWPRDTPPSQRRAAGEIVDQGSATFSGSTQELDLALTPGTAFHLSLEIMPASTDTPDPTDHRQYPPTPVHNRAFNIWQREDEIVVLAKTGRSNFDLTPGPWQVDIVGYGGCAAGVWFDDDYVGALQAPFFEEALTLGRGHLERYWNGRIDYTLRVQR